MESQKSEVLLRLAEVQARTGISRSQLFELTRRGEFPKPIPLVGRTRAWVASEVDAWVLNRIRSARGDGSAEGGK